MEEYQEILYADHCFPDATASAILGVAQLYGVTGPRAPGLRVLDLGCGCAGHLIAMAALDPTGTYVGVDRSEPQIAHGRETAAAGGVGNVALHAADARSVDLGRQRFDVIVCHGVYSWVPEDVRAAILRTIRGHLAAAGVAYVSANVLPGWRTRGTIRAVLLRQIPDDLPPRERISRARALLAIWESATADAADPAVAAVHRDLRALRTFNDAYLLYEHLAAINDPMWFGELNRDFAAAGLRYLGDVAPTLHRPLPDDDQERRLLGVAPDLPAVEELRDAMTHRMFRRNLLVHRESAADRQAHWRRLHGLWLQTALRRDPERDGAWVAPDGRTLTVDDPRTAAALGAIVDAAPRALAFDALAPASASVADRAALGEAALALVFRGAVEVRASPPPIADHLPDRPRASALARALSARDSIPNLRGESVGLPLTARAILRACDGTRDREALLAALTEANRTGEAEVLLDDARTYDRAALEVALDAVLDALWRSGFLVDGGA